MKKITLIIIFLLGFVSSYCQDVYRTNVLMTGTYNSYTKKWKYTEPETRHFTFTIQGRVVLVDDQAKSSYTTLRTFDSGEKYTVWDAVDEKLNECKIKISNDKNNNLLITVFYNDYCIVYIKTQ